MLQNTQKHSADKNNGRQKHLRVQHTKTDEAHCNLQMKNKKARKRIYFETTAGNCCPWNSHRSILKCQQSGHVPQMLARCSSAG
jgi:hypothetical protein